MGVRTQSYQVKAKDRCVCNVPATAGDYSGDRITIGVVPVGEIDQGFIGVTCLIEAPVGGPPGGLGAGGIRVELWLPRQVDATEAASARDLTTDYFFSGQCIVPAGFTGTNPTGMTTSFGSATWPLAGYSGAQIRVRSGGTQGTCGISVSAF